ncbi:MAG: ATP-binding protein [Myxococcota bacterium]
MDGSDDLSTRWWIRLRWAIVAAEALTLAISTWGLGLLLPRGLMFAVIGSQAVSNLWVSHARSSLQREAVRLLWLAADVAVLTVLLQLSGGPSNPFSALYFVQVTLAGMLLGRSATAAVWASSVMGYGLLFVEHRGVPELSHAHHVLGHGDAGFGTHLYGMFVAFAVTSGLVAYFVVRLSESLRARDAQLTAMRERASRARRVASLTTLAAGAAHELGTPLGTIAVVARELERNLDDPSDQEDIQVIREEVDRCREILRSMSGRAGDVIGETPEQVELAELLEVVRERLPQERQTRLDVLGNGQVRVPRDAFLQLLENLINNAFDASAAEERVEVFLEDHQVTVKDHGTGMDEATLARAEEPFFTTKPEGSGMGLGLFLTRATVEALGGTLALDSAPGAGTIARVELGA